MITYSYSYIDIEISRVILVKMVIKQMMLSIRLLLDLGWRDGISSTTIATLLPFTRLETHRSSSHRRERVDSGKIMIAVVSWFRIKLALGVTKWLKQENHDHCWLTNHNEICCFLSRIKLIYDNFFVSVGVEWFNIKPTIGVKRKGSDALIAVIRLWSLWSLLIN